MVLKAEENKLQQCCETHIFVEQRALLIQRSCLSFPLLLPCLLNLFSSYLLYCQLATPPFIPTPHLPPIGS